MKLNTAVFFGGESVEHEVSIISAHQAINALDPEKYNIIPIYVSKDRRFYISEKGLLRDMHSFTDLKALCEKCEQVTFVHVKNQVRIQSVSSSLFGPHIYGTIDVAIPIMHGTNGEDGTIQGYLEMLRIPYAGCDLYGAAVGQDKVLQKKILQACGVPVADWFYTYGYEMDEKPEKILEQADALGYPLVLKPSRTGSSIGIHIAHNADEYIRCFHDTRQYDEKVITEKCIIPLTEINCSVLGDFTDAKASLLEEVSHSDEDELLTFNDKYMGNGGKGTKSGVKSAGMVSAGRIVPAPVSKELTAKIQALSLKTFHDLGAAGVCRIDFLLNSETGEIYVNEINTIPGSLAYYLWTPLGLSFTQLMDRLVALALERERRRNQLTYSFETNILENFSEGNGTKAVKH